MEVNEKGEIRVRTVIENWRTLTEVEKKAIANPNQEFVTDKSESTYERIDFFHYVFAKKYSEVVIFNGKKLETLSKVTTKRGAEKFAFYVIFLLIGIGAMFYSNYRVKRYGIEKNIDDVAAASAVAAIAAVVAAVAAAVVAAVAAAVAAAAVVVAAVAAAAFITIVEGDIGAYSVSSVVFYAFSILAIVF